MSDDLIKRSDVVGAITNHCENECYYRGDNWCPQCQREEFQEAIEAVPSADRPQKVITQITFDEEKLREIVKEAVERFKEEYEITDRPQGEWIIEVDANDNTYGRCSICGMRQYAGQLNFCPDCGARMKGADDETDY